MEKGDKNEEMQVAPSSWKMQGNEFSSKFPEVTEKALPIPPF